MDRLRNYAIKKATVNQTILNEIENVPSHLLFVWKDLFQDDNVGLKNGANVGSKEKNWTSKNLLGFSDNSYMNNRISNWSLLVSCTAFTRLVTCRFLLPTIWREE